MQASWPKTSRYSRRAPNRNREQTNREPIHEPNPTIKITAIEKKRKTKTTDRQRPLLVDAQRIELLNVADRNEVGDVVRRVERRLAEHRLFVKTVQRQMASFARRFETVAALGVERLDSDLRLAGEAGRRVGARDANGAADRIEQRLPTIEFGIEVRRRSRTENTRRREKLVVDST